jgi:phosphatidylinositol alpha-1,6-mannosyltransferase
MAKILLVTRNFPPLRGGMERLLYHVYQELLHEFEVFLVGPSGAQDYLDQGTGYSGIFPVPIWRFLAGCQWHTYQAAKRIRPDLILSGSGVTVPAAIMAGKYFDAPVVTFLHGLDLVADHLLYKTLFLASIRTCNRVICNSNNTARLAVEAGLRDSLIHILNPGVALPTCPLSIPSGEFRNTAGIGMRPTLLSIGRLTKRKGLVEFIERCMPSIAKALPEIVLVIIGDEAKDAVGGAYGVKQNLVKAIESHNLAKNVILLGAVDDETLAQAYAASQLLVFPVIEQPHDIEGFGMVAVEAAAHGLPTVAFRVGGVPDAVADGVSGYLVNAGDYVKFTATIVAHLQQAHVPIVPESCRQFAEDFAWEKFGARLRKICRESII